MIFKNMILSEGLKERMLKNVKEKEDICSLVANCNEENKELFLDSKDGKFYYEIKISSKEVKVEKISSIGRGTKVGSFGF